MTQGQELELKTPAVEITARNEVTEARQNLLEDSQTTARITKIRPGATEVIAGADEIVPGMETPDAQGFCLNLSRNAKGASAAIRGETEFVADIRDPAEVDAALAKLKAGAIDRQKITEAAHDLESFIVGGPLGWGLYRANKESLDPVIDTTGKFSFAVSTGTLPKLAENIVDKPIMTALEFIVCPALPFVDASISVANEAIKK
ncbi:MAG: hypothetical protein IT342_24425 [Candidatus Melainabacteria bacterium]|nr:hypothetical protein [Candidatus Melainabacteria bacterium]